MSSTQKKTKPANYRAGLAKGAIHYEIKMYYEYFYEKIRVHVPYVSTGVRRGT